jgi:hypothetical protein
MKTMYNEGRIQSFQEETLGDLDGKEGYLVEPGTAEGTVKLLVTPGNEIGVIQEKPDARSTEVSVALLGSGGVNRYVAGGVIAKGGRFKGAAGGKVVAAASNERSIGKRLDQGNSADGDIFAGQDVVSGAAQTATYTPVAAGIHAWAGGAATTDSIAVAGLLATDIVLCTLVARAATETLVLAVNDAGNDQIDLTLSANGTDGTTKVCYQVLRAV